MRNPLVIYHAPCLDGFTAAYVAWRKFGDNAEYVGAGYEDDPVIPDVDNRTVYILDYSYKQNIMREIAARAARVIVLDHHKSAEEDLRPLLAEGVIEGEFDMNRSGAGMAWDYFFSGTDRLEFINYVEDRDLWRFDLPYSREINTAMFSYPYDFAMWDMFANGVSLLVSEGKAIDRKHMKDVRELSELAHRMNIAGFDVPVVNANYTYGSDIGALLCEGEPFAAYFYLNKNGDYQFGLRSAKDGVDVAKVAEHYGGGGHQHASGFRVASLEDL